MSQELIHLNNNNNNNNSNALVRSEETSELRPLNQGQESGVSVSRSSSLIRRINHRKITNPTVNGDQVTITVQDYAGDKVVGNSYEVTYPLQIRTLGYTHDFVNGVSHPKEEQFITVDDIKFSNIKGKVVANPEFVNKNKLIRHQKQIDKKCGQNGYEMDDVYRIAKPFKETLIDTENGKLVIKESELQHDDIQLYQNISGSKKTKTLGNPVQGGDGCNFSYQIVEITEQWKRPDGTIYTSRIERNDKLDHQTRINGYEMNDTNLEATPIVVTYVNTIDGEKIISNKPDYSKTVGYECVSVNENKIGNPYSDDNFDYQRLEILENYRRPDGTIFTKRREEVNKVAKPKLSPPQEVPQQWYVNQPAPGGSRDIIRNVLTLGNPGSDCTIM